MWWGGGGAERRWMETLTKLKKEAHQILVKFFVNIFGSFFLFWISGWQMLWNLFLSQFLLLLRWTNTISTLDVRDSVDSSLSLSFFISYSFSFYYTFPRMTSVVLLLHLYYPLPLLPLLLYIHTHIYIQSHKFCYNGFLSQHFIMYVQ